MTLENRRVFITGGTGFIGTYLIERLFKDNEVTCFDRETRNLNINYLLSQYGEQLERKLRLVQGDVRDSAALEKAIHNSQPEVVFHLASLAGVRQVVQKPLETMEVNVLGSYNLVNSLRKSKSKLQCLVFASTSEVYGPTTAGAGEDTFLTVGSPDDPRWAYAASKLFVEHMFIASSREVELPVVVARPFNIYGPRQMGEGAIHSFVEHAIRHEPLIVHGDGDQIRSWCYVEDCVDGFLLLADKGHGIYNVGNPQQALTTLMLARKVMEIAGSTSPIVMRPNEYTEVSVRVPSIDRIKALGFAPRIGLDEGLEITINWYRRFSHANSSG
jgi:dTDP-glucose 4,6-dehydratase